MPLQHIVCCFSPPTHAFENSNNESWPNFWIIHIAVTSPESSRVTWPAILISSPLPPKMTAHLCSSQARRLLWIEKIARPWLLATFGVPFLIKTLSLWAKLEPLWTSKLGDLPKSIQCMPYTDVHRSVYSTAFGIDVFWPCDSKLFLWSTSGPVVVHCRAGTCRNFSNRPTKENLLSARYFEPFRMLLSVFNGNLCDAWVTAGNLLRLLRRSALQVAFIWASHTVWVIQLVSAPIQVGLFTLSLLCEESEEVGSQTSKHVTEKRI